MINSEFLEYQSYWLFTRGSGRTSNSKKCVEYSFYKPTHKKCFWLLSPKSERGIRLCCVI